MKRLTIGVLDLLTDVPTSSLPEKLYAHCFRRQFASIMPQAVAAWCRRLGHRVHYATYFGQSDPRHLLPKELDVMFASTFTQASCLAYALAKLYRRQGALTVIGGPHAKSFPADSMRHFDIVVGNCNRALVNDIVSRRIDPPAIVASSGTLDDVPCVEERFHDIMAASFYRGRPLPTSIVPLLASVGCPYDCDFCIDWNAEYVALPKDRLAADLRFLAARWPRLVIAYHDPNFAVRFDETLGVIESMPEWPRNRYIMESSLSILKEPRLRRLQRTRCVYVAPGVEAWNAYASKAGASGKFGRAKLEQLVDHFAQIGRFVKGIDANFIFGIDADSGEEPVELTREFIQRLPQVWPTLNMLLPFGGTPLYDRLAAEGRILTAMPFSFYYTPYLAMLPKNSDPLTLYDRFIRVSREAASNEMLRRRLGANLHPTIRFIHILRTLRTRQELAECQVIRTLLAQDASFRAFHQGRSATLPEFYHHRFERRLGRFAELMPQGERTPDHGQRLTGAA